MEDNEEKTSYTLEEVEAIKSQMKEENEKAFDNKFNKAWAKEMSKLERQNSKKDELINLIMEHTGTKNMDELLAKSYKQYDVERPVVSEEDDKVLGKYDAKKLMDLDDLDEVQAEVERLADLERNVREDTAYTELENYLNLKKTEQKRLNEIKEAGLDESLLTDEKFNEFAKKFNNSISMKEVYEMYSKVNPKKQPFNTGSVKDSKAESDELFTEDEFMALTAKDLENPRIYEKAMKSRLYF